MKPADIPEGVELDLPKRPRGSAGSGWIWVLIIWLAVVAGFIVWQLR